MATDDAGKRQKLVSIKGGGKPNPTAFVTPSQDVRGHSDRVNFRVPQGYGKGIEILMRQFPELGWQTPSDFWRWAGHNAMETFEKKMNGNRDFSNWFAQQQIIKAVAEGAIISAELEETFKIIDASAGKLAQAGAPGAMTRMLRTVEAKISEIDNEELRGVWQKKLREKYGDQLKGASLKRFKDEDDDDDDRNS